MITKFFPCFDIFCLFSCDDMAVGCDCVYSFRNCYAITKLLSQIKSFLVANRTGSYLASSPSPDFMHLYLN